MYADPELTVYAVDNSCTVKGYFTESKAAACNPSTGVFTCSGNTITGLKMGPGSLYVPSPTPPDDCDVLIAFLPQLQMSVGPQRWYLRWCRYQLLRKCSCHVEV